MDYNKLSLPINPPYAEIRMDKSPKKNLIQALVETKPDDWDTNNFDLGGYLVRGTAASNVTTSGRSFLQTESGDLLLTESDNPIQITDSKETAYFIPRDGVLTHQPHWNQVADAKYNKNEIREK